MMFCGAADMRYRHRSKDKAAPGDAGVKMKTKNMSLKTALTAVVLAAPLAACGGDEGSNFGYGKNPPDEYNVVRRAPLIMPPEFNLRPPSRNDARPATPTGAELARLAVLPNAPKVPLSSAEQSLIDKAARGGIYGDGIREELTNRKNGKVSENADTVKQLTKDESKKK